MTSKKIISNIWKMHHFLRQFPILIMMMATHFAKLQAIASSAIDVGLKSIWKPSCSHRSNRSIRSVKSVRSNRSPSVWEAGRWLVLVNEYWSVSWWGNKEGDIFMEGSHLLTGESYYSYYCAKEHVLIDTDVGPTYVYNVIKGTFYAVFLSSFTIRIKVVTTQKRDLRAC